MYDPIKAQNLIELILAILPVSFFLIAIVFVLVLLSPLLRK